MKTRSILSMLMILAAAALVSGCAGASARVRAIGPAQKVAWPGVEEDALLGIKARENEAAATALGVQHIGPGVGDFRRGRVTEFKATIDKLNAPMGAGQ